MPCNCMSSYLFSTSLSYLISFQLLITWGACLILTIINRLLKTPDIVEAQNKELNIIGGGKMPPVAFMGPSILIKYRESEE